MSLQKQDADSECPQGSLFYVCHMNKFRGCCSVDPCALAEGCTAAPITRTPLAGSFSSSSIIVGLPNSPTPFLTPSSTSGVSLSSPLVSPTPATTSASVSVPKLSTHSATILGIVVGLLAVIVASLVLWFLRAKVIQLAQDRLGLKGRKDLRHSIHTSEGIFELEGSQSMEQGASSLGPSVRPEGT